MVCDCDSCKLSRTRIKFTFKELQHAYLPVTAPPAAWCLQGGAGNGRRTAMCKAQREVVGSANLALS